MTSDKILVILGGAGLLIFIYWFFFGKKEEAAVAGDRIDVLVDGGYKPDKIRIKKGRKTTLVFERKDPNACLEEIIIPDFKIKEYLPLNKKVEISLTPEKSGTFQTHCGMGMFHGKIIVE